MKPVSVQPAALARPAPTELALSGSWTSCGLGTLPRTTDALEIAAGTPVVADGSQVLALDTAGAWVLQTLLARVRRAGSQVTLRGLSPHAARLLDVVARQQVDLSAPAAAARAPQSALARTGRAATAQFEEAAALLAFVGASAMAAAGGIIHPTRIRWRPILFNIRSAGFDALPIVGLLSFLLGIVVAHQGAAQLKLYGANIYVADLVGLSMLREFAPLLTAIIVAGRSGSAYAAQIGTMAVTEEIDALRTLGIAPLELLVLPKVVALVIALPLLTVFADVLGVLGGMLMAQAQLGVSPGEFIDRFVIAVSPTIYLTGLGKAPVFAAVIAAVGCFQGLRTRGGADAVGRHTTRSVVHAIFLVIVADALFSVFFSALGL